MNDWEWFSKPPPRVRANARAGDGRWIVTPSERVAGFREEGVTPASDDGANRRRRDVDQQRAKRTRDRCDG